MTVWISDCAIALPRVRVSREQVVTWGLAAPSSWRSSFVNDRDEDALTLGLAAAREIANPESGSLALASQSLPYVRRVQAGLLIDALGLKHPFVSEHTTSSRAGTEALSMHAWRVEATGESALVVAAETGPRSVAQLASASAGAVALQLAPTGDIAQLEAIVSVSTEAPGLEYQPTDDANVADIGVPPYAQAIYRNLLAEALHQITERTGFKVADFTRIVIGGSEFKTAERYLRSLGGDPAQWRDVDFRLSLVNLASVGPLAGLVAAVDSATAGDRILVTSYGPGSALDAIVLRAGDRASGNRIERALRATRDLQPTELFTHLEVN